MHTDGHSTVAGFAGGAIIAPEGLVLALCDEASAFNRRSISSDAWASTTRGSDIQLFEYNQYLYDEMQRERAVVWILVLWGVFRIRVKVHERVEQLPPLTSSELLIGNVHETSLSLPTGRLGWMDVERAAKTPWQQIAFVNPGRYLCRLAGEVNGDHWNMNDIADYPPGDEDWVLHMAPV